MTGATKFRDRPHARVYSAWLELPTWRALSLPARALLVEILARYRPGENGKLAWPVRHAADILGTSKATAARALIELERNGWLTVATVSAFGGRPKAATYTLAMFANDVTGDPASRAYEHLTGESGITKRKSKPQRQSHEKDKIVPFMRPDGLVGRTGQPHEKDKPSSVTTLPGSSTNASESFSPKEFETR